MTRTGGERRRRALVDEAIRAFGRQGYEGASLEQIATACHVRKQTLLYYFPTKKALLAASLHAAGDRLAEVIADGLEGKETYWGRAEAVIPGWSSGDGRWTAELEQRHGERWERVLQLIAGERGLGRHGANAIGLAP